MCKGGGGSTKTTSTTSIDPTVKANYQAVVAAAQRAAGTPYNPFGGPQVAGFSPDQIRAMQSINALQGTVTPYINTASQYAAQGAAPIAQNLPQYNQQTLQQYQSPYLNDVVNATQANINQSNAIQQQQLASNAIRSGASPFGGDRAGIAAAELARNQNLASQQTIAGLYNQGFTNAQQALGQQQQLQLAAQSSDAARAAQAASQFAGLGTQALGANLTAAQAQLQAGTMQQQLAQQQVNVPYQNYLSAQQYPFQTTGWLASIVEGLGNQGGTTTTQAPTPSMGSQIAGGVLGGLGILGSTGAFGGSGWLSKLFKDGGSVDNDQESYHMHGTQGLPGIASFKNGGLAKHEREILKKAKGLGTGGDSDIVHVNEHEKHFLKNVLGGEGSINPHTGLHQYRGDPQGGGGEHRTLSDQKTTSRPIQYAQPAPQSQVQTQQPLPSSWPTIESTLYQTPGIGGSSIPFTFNQAPGYSNISIPMMGNLQTSDVPGNSVNPYIPHPITPNTPTMASGGAAHYADGGWGELNPDPSSFDPELDQSPQMDLSGNTIGIKYPSEKESLDTGMPIPQQSGGQTSANTSGIDKAVNSPWMALTDIGLGIMASPSPYAGQAIGQGALQGLGTYQAQKAQNIQNEEERQRAIGAALQNKQTQDYLTGLQKIKSVVSGGLQPSGIGSPAGTGTLPIQTGGISPATATNAPQNIPQTSAIVPSSAPQQSGIGPASSPSMIGQQQLGLQQGNLSTIVPVASVPGGIAPSGSQVVTAPTSTGGVAPMLDLKKSAQLYEIYSTTPGMQSSANEIAQQITKATPEGMYLGQDGALYLRPGLAAAKSNEALAAKGMIQDENGGWHWPAGYVQAQAGEAGAKASAEETARNISDLRYKPQIAGGEAWAKAPAELYVQQNAPYMLGEGQTRMVGSSPVASVPKMVETVDPNTGARYLKAVPVPAITPPGGNAPVPTGGMVQPSGSFSTSASDVSGAPVTQLGPLQQGSLEHRAATLEEQGKQIDQDANNAKQTEFLVDQMRRDMGTWEQGKFASQKENAKAYLQSAAKMMGIETPDLDREIGDFQAFQKNATRLTTQATKEVSSRAAFQEMQMISHAQPNADMSKGGLNQVFNQIYSISDFQQAKQQAAQAWRNSHGGTLDGFDTEWNKNVTPGAFLVTRMSPEDLQEMAAKMRSMPDGKEALAKLKSEVMWARQNGLVQ